jgi:WD40 repeat protein
VKGACVQAAAAAEAARGREEGQIIAAHSKRERLQEVEVSRDGKWFATCGQRGHAAVWDISTGTHVRTLHGNTDYICCVAWSPDGCLLATGSSFGTARCGMWPQEV